MRCPKGCQITGSHEKSQDGHIVNFALCREPEKGTVFDWRAKLKEEEKDNDPKNMWKKFDSAGPMKAIYQYIDINISIY